MATSDRRLLIWKLQKKLPELSLSQLQTVAHEIGKEPEGKTIDTSTLTEPELFDVVVDFIRSEKLKDLEDEGMSCLMLLLDMVEDLLTTTHTAYTMLVDEDAEPQHDLSPPTLTKTLTNSRDVDEGQSTLEAAIPAKYFTTARDSVKGVRVSPSSFVSDQVVRLTDVASLLPRREFKIHGGQLSDSGSEISYNSICKQIEEGLKEGFSESEVIREQ